MKEQYIKESTSEEVLAEKTRLTRSQSKKKRSSDEAEKFDFSAWQIYHKDGRITHLSDNKFNKRYTKV